MNPNNSTYLPENDWRNRSCLKSDELLNKHKDLPCELPVRYREMSNNSTIKICAGLDNRLHRETEWKSKDNFKLASKANINNYFKKAQSWMFWKKSCLAVIQTPNTRPTFFSLSFIKSLFERIWRQSVFLQKLKFRRKSPRLFSQENAFRFNYQNTLERVTTTWCKVAHRRATYSSDTREN